ncbi:hypothetical protein SESBI_48368 [Sesbania bispinosa]|nr:hypothetical protein SESBI_48368 [Sesbania bispinosa]
MIQPSGIFLRRGGWDLHRANYCSSPPGVPLPTEVLQLAAGMRMRSTARNGDENGSAACGVPLPAALASAARGDGKDETGFCYGGGRLPLALMQRWLAFNGRRRSIRLHTRNRNLHQILVIQSFSVSIWSKGTRILEEKKWFVS